MLRAALLGWAILTIGIGLLGLFAGCATLPMTVFGAILLAAVLCERWRYRPSHKQGGQTWQATGEQFIDPETGRLTQVQYRPETGERRYIDVVDPSSDGS